jgi:glycosyltransferase involved in cell wall biosynthesis
MASGAATIIAIPVKNEEARIGRCLDALSRQTEAFDQAVLLLNNCTDGTLKICKEFSRRSGRIRIVQHELFGDLASAGEARRLALEYALEMAGDGVILTTDADAVPGERWVADNLRALAQGADVVCGRAMLDPADAPRIPEALHTDASNEARLLSIQDEISAIIDTVSADPWPRHQDHSGASIAVRAATLRRAGGAPHVSTAEDRALIERLLLVDAKVRHAEIVVRVSGRLDGRAHGGMADTIKRRLQRPDVFTDERLEPTVDAYRRVLTKARLRQVLFGCGDADSLAEEILLGSEVMHHLLRAEYFGMAWAEVQRLSPVLHRRPVRFVDLQREIRQALALCDRLREEAEVSWIDHWTDHDVRDIATDENAG